MTHKYERVCWNCGKGNMVPDAQGVTCQDCGATWNRVPRPGAPVLIIVNDPLSPHHNYVKPTFGRPSDSAVRRVELARQKAMSEALPKDTPGE